MRTLMPIFLPLILKRSRLGLCTRKCSRTMVHRVVAAISARTASRGALWPSEAADRVRQGNGTGTRGGRHAMHRGKPARRGRARARACRAVVGPEPGRACGGAGEAV